MGKHQQSPSAGLTQRQQAQRMCVDACTSKGIVYAVAELAKLTFQPTELGAVMPLPARNW